MKLLDLWKTIRLGNQIITFFQNDCTIIDSGTNKELRKKYGNNKNFLNKTVHSIHSEFYKAHTELFITLDDEKNT